MKKNDKLIVVLGVVILVMASIGIYYWVPAGETSGIADVDDFMSVTGKMVDLPGSVTVSDECPFYPLIATPICVNYDKDCNQHIIPLYVQNLDNPSTSITRVKYEQLGMFGLNEYLIDGDSAKNVSLDVAEAFWESSNAALIIEYNQAGYELGVIATPLASYLSIPVIVTDEIDQEVIGVLNELGVEKTLICGENLEDFGDVLRFDNVEEIVDASIELIEDKFGEIDYITLTNPVDAFPPEVLDSKEFSFGPITIPSGASTRLGQALLNSGWTTMGTFEIPDDYKYALIKFEGVNLDPEDVDNYGDYVNFQIGVNKPDIPTPLQSLEIFTGSTTTGGVAVRDSSGKLISDKIYVEAVVYDRGGEEYTVRTKAQWMLKKEGGISAHVVVEKLENPIYSMMKELSSLAPYLTAYHKGLVFGKSDFAFAANDSIITDQGETCPGFYMPRRNPNLTPMANKHIFDKIHEPLNELLAKLADIPLEEDRDIKNLQKYYKNSPVYIAIVGGATVVPNYIYQNYVEPVDYWDGQYNWGVGTPSDVIYGNIDPVPYDWSNLANDVYTKYPYQENIVGRITGWDTQDASALIARSIFYSYIIEQLDEWKDNFALLLGDGQDFQEPLFRYPIAKLFGAAHAGEPMKLETGYGEIVIERTVEELIKPIGFTPLIAYKEEAMKEGFSDGEIHKLKFETSLMNKFLFLKPQIRKLVGDGVVKGGDILENSNFIFTNGHGNMAILAMDGIDLVSAGLGGPISHFLIKKFLEVTMPYLGPGASLASKGQYTTRTVECMEFGPSFMWLESCMCGKIDGMYPENSLGQSFLHAGITSLIASPTGSNIAGGYLEPKNRASDTPFSVLRAYISSKLDARKGIYVEPHFGYLIYQDLCESLKNDDTTVGLAFRDAKNNYLPQDADWELWWSPPLVETGNFLDNYEMKNTNYETMKNNAMEDPFMLKNKYTSFQEYMLFGDPAFNPYEPCNEGS